MSKTVSNTNCCVPNCHSRKGKDSSISFHQFPKKNQSLVYVNNRFGVKEEIDKYEGWMIALKMGKPATSGMSVCSQHFSKNDFILPGRSIPSKRPRLKRTAVPSQNLPKTSFELLRTTRKCRETIKQKTTLANLQNLLGSIPVEPSTENTLQGIDIDKDGSNSTIPPAKDEASLK